MTLQAFGPEGPESSSESKLVEQLVLSPLEFRHRLDECSPGSERGIQMALCVAVLVDGKGCL